MFTESSTANFNPSKPADCSWLEALSMSFSRRLLARIRHGQLTIAYPDQHQEIFGDPSSRLAAKIELKNYKLFFKIVCRGGLGFGESYVEGDWSSDELTAVHRVLLQNAAVLDESHLNILKPLRLFNLLTHWLKRNTLQGSRANIQAHYDLGNALFASFLDPSMTYSCGIFRSHADSLEGAQRNKIFSIIRKARIEPQDSVLEIGSGWGALAIEAAQAIGCRVTGITLSREQLALSRERASNAGLSERVIFELADYRKISGSYDKIVSVEMLEAVGKGFLGSFFSACERLLRPDGVVVLQVITFPDQWYDSYLKRADWIQRYVFPGSHIPSLSALLNAAQRHSNLIVESVENIGPNYALTLAEWRRRFFAAKDYLESLGYDRRFSRIWEYYLCSCEAEFERRWLNVHQIVLTRPNNLKLIAWDCARLSTVARPLRSGRAQTAAKFH